MQKQSGIYQIRNLVNGNIYVGQTVDIKKRKQIHFYKLNKHQHHSVYLQRAFDKYGENNFIFEIILYCEKDCLTYYEQMIVDMFCPEYNICKICVKSRLGISSSKLKRFLYKNKTIKEAVYIAQKITNIVFPLTVKIPSPKKGEKLSNITKKKMRRTLNRKFFKKRIWRKIQMIFKNILKKFNKITARRYSKALSQEHRQKISNSMMASRDTVERIKTRIDAGSITAKQLSLEMDVTAEMVSKVKNGYYKQVYGI